MYTGNKKNKISITKLKCFVLHHDIHISIRFAMLFSAFQSGILNYYDYIIFQVRIINIKILLILKSKFQSCHFLHFYHACKLKLYIIYMYIYACT